MAFCHWVWRLDPCKHCGSSNVELMYLGSKNRLDGGPDTPPIMKCRDCGKWSNEPIERILERPKDKNIEKCGLIHNAKCCAKCAFYSPVDITTGECDKNLRLVRIYQVCDYFIESEE